MASTIALVTGATSGIGLATARLLASKKIDLILCGRRKEKLDQLESDLSQITKVISLDFDVSNKEIVFEKINNLPSEWQNINYLINNAGNAHGLAPIQDGELNDWDAMIDSNVRGLLYVTKAVLPMLLQQDHAHIINIGSIAGKEAYTNGNVYCATKFAVDALTTGMRMDLNQSNVKVSVVHPGLVETEFSEVRFKGDADRAKKVYQGYQPLSPEDVAQSILYILEQPTHVNIAEILILPKAQASATIVNKSI